MKSVKYRTQLGVKSQVNRKKIKCRKGVKCKSRQKFLNQKKVESFSSDSKMVITAYELAMSNMQCNLLYHILIMGVINIIFTV